MKILQNEIIETQTNFSTNFGGKLSFIVSFLFPERLHHCCYIYFHCSYLYNYYNYSRTLCIKYWVSDFILRFNKNFLTLRIPLKEGIGGEREGDFTDNFSVQSSNYILRTLRLWQLWQISCAKGDLVDGLQIL